MHGARPQRTAFSPGVEFRMEVTLRPTAGFFDHGLVWLVRLRWIAMAGLFLVVYLASRPLGLPENLFN